MVSSPHNRQGSVFRYNFDRKIRGQGYKYSKLLSDLPTILNADSKEVQVAKLTHTDWLYAATHTHLGTVPKRVVITDPRWYIDRI